MRVLCFDTETCLIRPAQQAPRLVCVTWQFGDEPDAHIEHVSTIYPKLRKWLQDPNILWVGHNVAFDLAVIAEQFPDLRDLIFAAYRANRVTDTMIRQQLLDIAAGCYRGRVDAKGKRQPIQYTLECTARRNANMHLVKDAWRLSYGEFLETPLSQWPARAIVVQAKALTRQQEIDLQIDAATATKDKDRAKALKAIREPLADMVASDPSRCTEYPLDDARATLGCYVGQEKHAARFLKDQFRQARAAFALHLNSCWGMCVDAEGLTNLKTKIQEDWAELDEELRLAGLVKADGVRDTKAAKKRMIRVCEEEGLVVVRTDAHFEEKLTWEERKKKGLKPRCKAADGTPLDDGHDDCAEHICLDSEACDRCGDELLIAYAERQTLNKQLTNDIPALEQGVLYPVHTRYGLAGTGRSTSSKPNIQNQSKRDGFRESFIARPGMLFAECDYPTLELYCLAQCCITWLGKSKLAEILLSGRDPHLAVAATILQKSYEWCAANKNTPEVEKARQLAKPANFGFPGGMGVPKFVMSTRKAVVKEEGGRAKWEAMNLTELRAKQLREEWFATYPEMQEYFARVSWLVSQGDGRALVETLFTGRWRGQATYCATSNNGFQALGSDCAKNAAWLIAEAQYVDRKSPLFNTRSVAFVHDEFIAEVPDDSRAHDAAYALADRMIVGANEYLPDVPIPMSKMEPLLMKRWAKKAKARFDDNQRLIAWAA